MPSFSIGDVVVELSSNRQDLAERFQRVLCDLPRPSEEATAAVSLVIDQESTGAGGERAEEGSDVGPAAQPTRFTATLDGDRIGSDANLDRLEQRVTRALNRLRLDRETDHLHLHAGAVARGDGALLVIGPSGAGKSTLVAKLVAESWAYLTDEQVPLTTAGAILPYPRPVTLRKASWEFFAHVESVAEAIAQEARVESTGTTGTGPHGTGRLEVPASLLGQVYRAHPPQVDLIVIPNVTDAAAACTELSAAETVERLVADSLDLERAGLAGMKAIVELGAGTAAFVVSGSDLDVTAAKLGELFELGQQRRDDRRAVIHEAPPKTTATVSSPGRTERSDPTAEPVPGAWRHPDAHAWMFEDETAVIYRLDGGLLARVDRPGFDLWCRLGELDPRVDRANLLAEELAFVDELTEAQFLVASTLPIPQDGDIIDR